MEENVKQHCPSCGLAYEETSVYCSRCGYKLKTPPRGRLSIKWILFSMPVFFAVQLVPYITVFFTMGLEYLLQNLVIITYTGIPPILFITALIFAYISKECSVLDLTISTLLLFYVPIIVSGVWVLIKHGIVEFGGFSNFIIPPVCGMISYAGAWGGKKLRARRIKAST
jgi:predicted nucleic acid-binding Zn ribbon protein